MRRMLAVMIAGSLLVAGCTAQGPATDELYTHCGIHELNYGGKWYVREGGALTDGSGNPPAGWDNPYYAGHVTVSGSTATFTDDNGHREIFTERPGATSPLKVCS